MVQKVSVEDGPQTIDSDFRARREEETLAGQVRSGAKAVQDKFATADQQMLEKSRHTPVGRVVRNRAAANLRKKRKKRASVEDKILARAKVTAANGWIVGWVMFFYTFVQLPFALVSNLSIGIAFAVYSLVVNTIGQDAVNFLVNVLNRAFSTFGEAVVEITFNLFSINTDPIILFLVPFVAIVSLNFLQLMICWFIYSALGIKSLSGSFSSAKIILFILAIFGTIIPVLNLFPLILVWVLLIWFKPN